jgi:hypothetical protein
MKSFLVRLLACVEETDELYEALQHSALEPVEHAVTLAHASKLLSTLKCAALLPKTNGRSVVTSRCDIMLGSVRLSLCNGLSVVLRGMGWPKLEPAPTPASLEVPPQLSELVSALTAVQLASAALAEQPQPKMLWCVDALAAPVIVRFRFHFRTPRPSNRPEKPEWMFVHVLSVLRTCRPFIDALAASVVQAGQVHCGFVCYLFVLRCFDYIALCTQVPLLHDLFFLFVSCVLTEVCAKVAELAHALAGKRLLVHLMDEAVSFERVSFKLV